MTTTVLTYVLYLALSGALTVWVGRTLFRHGQGFLDDVFEGDSELAGNVNRLLVVGFYLLNLGLVALALRVGVTAGDLQGAVETLATKVGGVAVLLGVVHFVNLWVLARLRRRALDAGLDATRPPVAPDFVQPVRGPGAPQPQPYPYPYPAPA